MKYFKNATTERTVSVTVSPQMYKELLHGRKGAADTPPIRGCGTHDELIRYIDRAWGLLGSVEEVRTA